MNSDEESVTNRATGTLTYMPWYEHVRDMIRGHWKVFVLYCVGGFGIFWGLIEAASFYYPSLGFDNVVVLFVILAVCCIGAVFRSVHEYGHAIPAGLENEPPLIHEIARSKRLFWEFRLAHELVKNRIEEIDQRLDDIVNNRVHIKVTKSMDAYSYIQWIQTRPANLLRIVGTAKQLLIFDLVSAIYQKDGKEIDYLKLIRVADLIRDSYRSALDFEIEGREILVPEGFELVHEIQSEWVSVIRDGFHQMLEILKAVAERAKNDFSPVTATITFHEAPRIDEFCEEIERAKALANELTRCAPSNSR